MTRVTLSEAGNRLSDLVNIVRHDDTQVIIQENERDAAAIISIEDLHLLDALIVRYENELDIEEAKRVLSEENKEEFESWEAVKSRFGQE